MCPGPIFCNGAVNHRSECSRLRCGGLVIVDDESSQHNQRRDVMNDIANRNDPSGHYMIKPHQYAGDQEEYDADDNGPEVKLLSGVKKSGIGRLQLVSVQGILLNTAYPAAVCIDPTHRT